METDPKKRKETHSLFLWLRNEEIDIPSFLRGRNLSPELYGDAFDELLLARSDASLFTMFNAQEERDDELVAFRHSGQHIFMQYEILDKDLQQALAQGALDLYDHWQSAQGK